MLILRNDRVTLSKLRVKTPPDCVLSMLNSHRAQTDGIKVDVSKNSVASDGPMGDNTGCDFHLERQY